MNYKDYFKRLAIYKENVDPKELEMGAEDEFKDHPQLGVSGATKTASQHLKKKPDWYSKAKEVGLEECGMEECKTCGCGMKECQCEDNGGLPKVGGALAVPHIGRPIHMSKIIQVGKDFGGKACHGEQSGYTAVDKGGVKVTQGEDKETITAGGKPIAGGVATKSVGGAVVPGEGQKQGGPNSKGTISGTAKMDGGAAETSEAEDTEITLQESSKKKLRGVIKSVLKEIKFNKTSGKWQRITEGDQGYQPKTGAKCSCQPGKQRDNCSNCEGTGYVIDFKAVRKKNENTVNMKMGPSYKVVQKRQYKVSDDDFARANQYEPDLTEMYDEEEIKEAQTRYDELMTAQRNLTAEELSEMKGLETSIANMREVVDMKMGPSYKTVQPTLAKTSDDDFARTNQYDPQVSEETPDTSMRPSYIDPISDEPEEDEPDQGWHGEADPSIDPSGEPPMTTKPGAGAPNIQKALDAADAADSGPSSISKTKSRASSTQAAGMADLDAIKKELGLDRANDPDHMELDEPEIHPSDLEEDESNQVCDRCNGSGEGMYDGTTCQTCGGSGDSDNPRGKKNRDEDGDEEMDRRRDRQMGLDEAGGGAVQHSSMRTVGNGGNLPQATKTRWANDLDESEKKSEVRRTIEKGNKAKKANKPTNLKFKGTKKPSTGVHKKKP